MLNQSSNRGAVARPGQSRRAWTQSGAILLVSIVCAAFVPRVSRAGETEGDQGMGNKIKVAYVYNFPKFIEWPREKAASARNPFRVCVLGTDPIRTTLGELSIRAIEERPFEVVDVQMGSPMPSCHLLFICRSEAAGLTSILEQVRGLPVLTVSDIPQFALQGGMIGFVTFNEKIKVEINHSLVLRAGLKVRAKLLEIARIVP